MTRFLFPFLQPLAMISREAPTEGAPASSPSLLNSDTSDAATTPDGAGNPPADASKDEAKEGEGGDPKEGEAPKEGENSEGKEDESPAPEPVTMEAIQLPENMTISEDQQEAFLAVVNDPELSRADLVNKLIEMQGQSLQAAEAASVEAWANLRSEWQEAARNLPEIGGENLSKTLADIKSGLTAAGATSDAFEAFDVTGAGDNPHLVQLMHKLVQPFLEKPPASGKPVSTQADRAARMYPSMAKEK